MDNNRNRKKIILFVCGSFNPPTLMHLRMFEIARDYYHKTEQIDVIGGIVSPIHELYRKPNVTLASNEHRLAMMKLALFSSDWIRLSDWETKQPNFTPTLDVLRYHQNYLDSILKNDVNQNGLLEIPNWLPNNITEYRGQSVQIRIFYGADILDSFVGSKNSKGLNKCASWTDEEVFQPIKYIENILIKHDLVVITRGDLDPHKKIFESDLLSKLKAKITIIENWERNEISSSLIRILLRRGQSVKYLLNDDVIKYIRVNKLYGSICGRN